MTRRDVIRMAVSFDEPPYVPWHIDFTEKPLKQVIEHFGTGDLSAVGNHIFNIPNPLATFREVELDKFRDAYGTVWDRSIDKDIGTPCEYPLPEPTLNGYTFPRVEDYADEQSARKLIEDNRMLFGRFEIGFSLFERAWTMRSMEGFLTDMLERPQFAHELLDAICEHDLMLLEWAMQFEPEMVHFGDDWGSQHGLIMGPRLWREFIKPRLARLYGRVREAGKVVSIHSCGDVDELFTELIEIGLDVFNPFQPEVMDVYALKREYHGKLAFHGGMSTQRVLPFGSPGKVRQETEGLLREIGRGGGYIFAPAHATPGDVPLDNILAMLDVLHSQPGAAEIADMGC